jgi:hypothetical protein
MKNLRWKKLLFFMALGGVAGYAYYYFIGCASGSCALSSNPYLMTGYGLGAGIVFGWDTRKKKTSEAEK